MDQDNLTPLINKTSSLLQLFEQECTKISQDLKQLIQTTPGLIKQSTEEQLAIVPKEILNKIKKDINDPISYYEHSLRSSGDNLQKSAQILARQLTKMESIHKKIIWKMFTIMLLSLLILLGGATGLWFFYQNEIKENQISAELLRVYNQADAILCGENLCIRPDPLGKKYGNYIPVKHR